MAGRIADRVVREIVDRSDMVAVVGDAVKLQRAGKEFRGLCPFHGEKSASFYVNPHTKVFMCHGCGAGGDIIKFVREIRGLNFVEAVEWLGERAGIAVEREDMSQEDRDRERQERSQRGHLLALNAAALRYFRATFERPAGAAAKTYAIGRGLQPDTIERFGVGAAADSWDGLSTFLHGQGFAEDDIIHVGLGMARRNGSGLVDRFRDRLMFPVYSTAGDLVAFGGRDLSDRKDVAKYMNSPESELAQLDVEHNNELWRFFKKSRVVFGLWQARGGIRRLGTALLVEGNIDVLTLHQAGFDNAVAPMGTAVTAAQLAELRRFTDRLIICMDGDKAGRAATMKTIPIALAGGFDGKVVRLPDGEDPDSMLRKHGMESLKALIDGADDMVTAFVDTAIGEWDGTLAGRIEVGQRVEAVLATIPNALARVMARQQLQSRLNLSPEVLRAIAQQASTHHHDHDDDDTAMAKRQLPAEPPLPRLELELAESTMWYPPLLLEMQRVGGLDFVQHPNLHFALHTLANKAEAEGAADVHALRGWLMELPDSQTRRSLLKALVEAPRVAQDALAVHIEAILDSLELKAAMHQLAELQARSRSGLDRSDEAASAVFEIRNRIEVLRRRRQVAGVSVPQVGGGQPSKGAQVDPLATT